MYVAMNRFKVLKEKTEQFEQRWLSRESYLHEFEGFMEFHMLRGPEREDHILYSSYTLWARKEDFDTWTTSERFKMSHKRADTAPGEKMLLGHPQFEGFDVIQTIDMAAKKAA